MPIADDIKKILNTEDVDQFSSADWDDLDSYLKDGMYIIVKITSDEDGEIQVKALDGGQTG